MERSLSLTDLQLGKESFQPLLILFDFMNEILFDPFAKPALVLDGKSFVGSDTGQIPIIGKILEVKARLTRMSSTQLYLEIKAIKKWA